MAIRAYVEIGTNSWGYLGIGRGAKSRDRAFQSAVAQLKRDWRGEPRLPADSESPISDDKIIQLKIILARNKGE